jgi:DNA primase
VFGVKSPTGANSDFEELLSRARQVAILDVVSDVLEVRKRGQGYMALCPFHNDKNPSLRIYEDTNTFHCFGCHKGGDAITFVRLHFGYGFRQAVEYLTGGSEDE